RALVFSSTMAQYLPAETYRTTRTVVDFVDVDSEKWLAYAAAKPWPLSALYRREGLRLRDYETVIARRAAASVFVSAPEAELFGSLLAPPLPSVQHVDNGVDLAYFHPDDGRPSPYAPDARVCVFTGAMDYWANVDAVTWFADEVLPRIRAACPATEFWIVGSRPAPEVRALAQRTGIHVTGTVPDVRPYVQHARVVVAPLRIARGIQNKVLEGMAMNKPIVGTTAAFEGIRCGTHPALCVTDEPARFAQATERFLQPGPPAAIDGVRCYVEATHDWRTNLTKLDTLLEA
ncbi:MAG: TIGR03087 family PEP-CTERM/XrtA system glycosyltransferase, partial [Gammaproteobacteria bacterium]